MAFPIMAIPSIAQMILDIGAQKRQNQLTQMSLNETRRSNMESEKLAKSTQTDAMGNTVRYIEGLGFVSEASPIVKAILDAGAKEQLANLREDQPRERAAAIRQDDRSKNADSEYRKAFDNYRLGRKPNENEAVSDEVLLTLADRETSPKYSAALLNQALRSGNPSLVQEAYGDQEKGSLTAALIRAKRAGTEQFLREKSGRDQVAFNELGALRNTADNTPDTTPQYSSANEQLAGRQDSAMARLINTIANNGSRMASSYQSAAGNVKPLNVGGIFEALAGEYGKTAEQKALEEALYNAQLTGANLSTATNKAKLAEIYQRNQGAF